MTAMRSLIVALILWLPFGVEAATQRLALVIGNNAYSEGVLKNPINDARMMAATLRELDFEVQVLENADRLSMQRAMVEFGRKLRDGTVGLFYFAGHGMQVRGSNYLIPVKTNIESEDEVEVEAIDVSYVLARMATAKNQFNIVILDACRNNPFQRSFRSTNNGLAAISAPTGTMIAYATAPGSVANDGDGANGIYTAELVAALKKPGLSMEETFKQARGRVIQRTQGKQTPWESSSVVGEFYFRAPESKVAALTAAPGNDAGEITFWNTIKDSQDPRDFQAYIEAYPNGLFNRLARIRISNLSDTMGKAQTGATPSPAQQSAPAQVAQPSIAPAQVASLKQPPATAAVVAPIKSAGNLEATLKQNWPAVQAAIKTHMETHFEIYRQIIPATEAITDLQFHKAELVEIVDAASGKVNVLVTGARYGRHGFGNATPWAPYTAVFGYDVSLQNDKLVIGDYRYVAKTPAAVSSAAPGTVPLTETSPVSSVAFEAYLQKNWPAVQAAVKAHMEKNFEIYRNMIPSTEPIYDLQFHRADLQDLVDPASGKVNVLVTGARYGRHAQSVPGLGNATPWSPYTAVFGYVIKIVDDKIVIEDYRYISKT